MLIDLNKPLVAINQEPAANLSEDKNTLGKFLALLLCDHRCNKLNSLKTIPWSFSLFKNQPIEIDSCDTDFLIEFIESLENTKVITPIISYQLKDALKTQKNAQEPI